MVKILDEFYGRKHAGEYAIETRQLEFKDYHVPLRIKLLVSSEKKASILLLKNNN